jgi:hypothetical protein
VKRVRRQRYSQWKLLFAAAALSAAATAEAPRFRHHFIAQTMPDEKSPGLGSSVLADFDKDGDLDFAVLVRNGPLLLFENRGREAWAQHTIGEAAVVQLGSTALDVDRDGWIDIVIGGYWYRNPGKPAGAPFARYSYDSRIRTEIHDIAAADVNGDGRTDLIVLGDREGCFWYDIPKEPARDGDWPRTLITDAVLNDKDDIHGGLAPNGVGDLDGDGDPDVFLTDRWMRNDGQGARWTAQPVKFGKRGPWGLSSRAWIIDLDRDGDNDIVVMGSDQKESDAGWLENRDGEFRFHALPITAEPRGRGSFHSLAVADFDGDGDPDIATAEQEDPSILPPGATPRFFLWINLDGKGRRWQEHVILDAKTGGHDLKSGDIDGDGDIDIASKIWRRWPESGNEGRPHVDWLENLSK